MEGSFLGVIPGSECRARCSGRALIVSTKVAEGSVPYIRLVDPAPFSWHSNYRFEVWFTAVFAGCPQSLDCIQTMDGQYDECKSRRLCLQVNRAHDILDCIPVQSGPGATANREVRNFVIVEDRPFDTGPIARECRRA